MVGGEGVFGFVGQERGAEVIHERAVVVDEKPDDLVEEYPEGGGIPGVEGFVSAVGEPQISPHQ